MDFSLSSMNVLTTVIKSLRKKYNKLLTLHVAACFSNPFKNCSAVSCSPGCSTLYENLPLPDLGLVKRVEILSQASPVRDKAQLGTVLAAQVTAWDTPGVPLPFVLSEQAQESLGSSSLEEH